MLENRRYVIVGAFLLVGLLYLSRLFYLQIVDDSYALESSSNSIKRVIEIPYRGQIYDRTGKLIVYNTPVYDLYVTPKQVRIADTLAFCRLMELTRDEFDSIMTIAKTYSPVRASLFLRQLSKEDYARIQDALVDYHGFEPRISSTRTYATSTFANALGYVSQVSKHQLEAQETPYYRQGDYIGHNGLEEQYEPELRGRRGVKFVMQNVRGINKGSWKNGEFDTMAVAGQNLYTTIDLNTQQYADSLMQNKVGCVLAVEPATGEILVSASAPTYDPNLLSSRYFSKNYAKLIRNPYKPLINRPVMASYRPGSTFKLIQALIAQQEGTLTPDMVYSHAGAPVKCHCRGNQNLMGAVQYSCNPYFYYVFRRLIYNNSEKNTFKASAVGLQKWHDMVSKFGIGQRLGVDLPSELRGNLPDVEYYDALYHRHGEDKWKFSNVYSLGIGEGELLISPMKLVNLAATVANRGYYITPHYIKGFNKVGEAVPEPYKERHSVGVEPRYFDPVVMGMRMAVVHGTVLDARADINGIDLCGKTGTSQNARKGHKFDHSIFIAFAPMNNPKIAVAVFVENAGWGGDAAASVAALIAERYIKGRTDAQGLMRKVMNSSYLPAVPGRVLPKLRPNTAAPEPESLRNDTLHKPAARPLMTRTTPDAGAKPATGAGASGN